MVSVMRGLKTIHWLVKCLFWRFELVCIRLLLLIDNAANRLQSLRLEHSNVEVVLFTKEHYIVLQPLTLGVIAAAAFKAYNVGRIFKRSLS